MKWNQLGLTVLGLNYHAFLPHKGKEWVMSGGGMQKIKIIHAMQMSGQVSEIRWYLVLNNFPATRMYFVI